mmetsp:Transcript_44393/g.96453  ORF Transcript_44393/g.96453 Transcript_44393/m.96453 type:complete len:204 (+) Transcript_44393:348-959(+)
MLQQPPMRLLSVDAQAEDHLPPAARCLSWPRYAGEHIATGRWGCRCDRCLSLSMPVGAAEQLASEDGIQWTTRSSLIQGALLLLPSILNAATLGSPTDLLRDCISRSGDEAVEIVLLLPDGPEQLLHIFVRQQSGRNYLPLELLQGHRRESDEQKRVFTKLCSLLLHSALQTQLLAAPLRPFVGSTEEGDLGDCARLKPQDFP